MSTVKRLEALERATLAYLSLYDVVLTSANLSDQVSARHDARADLSDLLKAAA